MKKTRLLLAALLASVAFAQTPVVTPLILSWTDNSTNETGFIVERQVDAGPFVEMGRTSANAVLWSDLVSVAAKYTYRVKAFNATEESSYSNSTSYTLTGPKLPAPSNAAIKKQSTTTTP